MVQDINFKLVKRKTKTYEREDIHEKGPYTNNINYKSYDPHPREAQLNRLSDPRQLPLG